MGYSQLYRWMIYLAGMMILALMCFPDFCYILFQI